MNKKSLALKNVASRSDLLFLARKLLLPNVPTIFEWYVIYQNLEIHERQKTRQSS